MATHTVPLSTYPVTHDPQRLVAEHTSQCREASHSGLVGALEGTAVVGNAVGALVGSLEGTEVGSEVGVDEGASVGDPDGEVVGTELGVADGCAVGFAVDGALVGAEKPQRKQSPSTTRPTHTARTVRT